MKVKLTENQYSKLILLEDENPYYNDQKINGENLNALWAAIKKKQEELYNETFSDLDELTKSKAKIYGEDRLDIPRVIAMAGNSKVPQNVLMINITSALACPSYYLGICTIKNGACYAQRGENQYPNSRNRNLQNDLMNTELLRKYEKGNKKPMKDYFSLVEMYIQIGNAAAKNIYNKTIDSLKRRGKEITPQLEELVKDIANEPKITDIRLNEAGDFPCQLSVDLWSKFAKKVGKKYGINVHAYTARNLDFSRRPSNFSVLPSHKDINIGDEPNRMFRAVNDSLYDSLEGGDKVDKNYQPILGIHNNTFFYKCPCGEGEPHCDLCRVCFYRNKTNKPYTIFVRYHGLTAANGLKHLFKKEEIDKSIQLAIQNGWVTPQEAESYNSPTNQTRLDTTSNKIDNMRGKEPKPLGKRKRLRNNS